MKMKGSVYRIISLLVFYVFRMQDKMKILSAANDSSSSLFKLLIITLKYPVEVINAPFIKPFCLFFCLFYLWLPRVFIAVRGFLQLHARASHCGGLSWCRAQAPWFPELWFAGSVSEGGGSGATARGLSSRGPWVELLCGIWSLPGPGIELVFTALQVNS